MDRITLNFEYPDSFKQLVEDFSCQDQFIGIGNPNADILIIGKEMAINTKKNASDFDKDMLRVTISENIERWKRNINNAPLIGINNWVETNPCDWSVYNPLYPFYGQYNKRFRKRKDGMGNGGTSVTELNYQKLVSLILGKQGDFPFINYHRYAFTTELSTFAGKNNSAIVQNEDKRISSIVDRQKLWSEPFFRKFPITILAAAHYPEKYKINLYDAFGVIYEYSNKQPIGSGRNKKFYKVFRSEDNKRILIQTNQLSTIYGGINELNEVISQIAKICLEFRKFDVV